MTYLIYTISASPRDLENGLVEDHTKATDYPAACFNAIDFLWKPDVAGSLS